MEYYSKYFLSYREHLFEMTPEEYDDGNFSVSIYHETNTVRVDVPKRKTLPLYFEFKLNENSEEIEVVRVDYEKETNRDFDKEIVKTIIIK